METNPRPWLLLLLLAALASCAEAVAPDPADVASIVVEPGTPSLHVGDEIKLQATVRGMAGEVIPGRPVFWSTRDPSVATVSPDGTVSAVAPGTTLVAASAGGMDTVAEVRVRPRPVGTVVLAPDSLRITAGGIETFQATLRDDRGNVVTGREIRWSSSAPTVATVDGSGVVRGIRPGTSVITAESEGKTASRPVRVVPGAPSRLVIVSGDGQQARAGAELPIPLAVRVLDAHDNPVAGVRVTWEVEATSGSVAPAAAHTDEQGTTATRWRVGSRPGAHRAVARVEGVAPVTFTAQVTGGPPTNVSVQPASADLNAIDATVELHATAVDEFGNPVEGAIFTWTSLSSAVATVDGNGRVRALANGTARIVAATEGVADTATVRVQQVIDRVRVEPRSAALHGAGSSVQLSATARDRNDHPVPSVSFSWTSLNPLVAQVDGSGRVTAVAAGTAAIRASAGGRQDAATITVTIAVDPPRPSALRIVSGNGQTAPRGTTLPNPLVVEVVDQYGNPFPGATVTWSATRGGSLSPSTVVTGANGRASVQWTLGTPAQVQHATARLQATGDEVTFEAQPQ
jgi:uncharacterized protein YjdB